MSIPENSGGRSLTWILFPSVVLAMAAVFIAVQLLGILPEAVTLSVQERLDPAYLAKEVDANLSLLLLIVALMMAGIYVALRVGLRPLQHISAEAANIGPATISQRLPLSSTPREIVPLVLSFNAALDRLEAGWRAQREFSANAAHELRTPLATLRVQIESLLPDQERDDAMEEFDRLGRLVAQLLALAEADSGDNLRKMSFDLAALTRTQAGEMAAAILASGSEIAFESACEEWPCYGVPGLVQVAVRNLIENAVRHTGAGCEIIISIDASGRLAVRDNGPGIPAAFQQRLFQRFSKADAHGGGAGLGLSIVQRVMAVHGGTVRFEPAEVGATFTLDFSASCAAVQDGIGG